MSAPRLTTTMMMSVMRVLAVAAVCGQVVWASHPNLLRGQRMGETLRSIAPEEAEEAQAELMASQKALVNPAVASATAKINARAEKGVPPEDICDRDYQSPCPIAWQMTGKKCLAPKSYAGGCKHLQSFADMDDNQKREFGEKCSAPWPCKDKCTRNWEALCPEGWSDVGAGFCEGTPPMDCRTRYKLDVYTVDKKERLAAVCGFEWPCMPPCVKDYGAACPEGWNEAAGGMCVASPDYSGDCDYGMNATLLGPEQKAAFEEKCSVAWPCSKGEVPEAKPISEAKVALPDGPVSPTGEIISPAEKAGAVEVTAEKTGGKSEESVAALFNVPSGPMSANGQIVPAS